MIEGQQPSESDEYSFADNGRYSHHLRIIVYQTLINLCWTVQRTVIILFHINLVLPHTEKNAILLGPQKYPVKVKTLLIHIPSLSWIRISAPVEKITTLGFVENKKNLLKSSSPSSISSSMMAIFTD